MARGYYLGSEYFSFFCEASVCIAPGSLDTRPEKVMLRPPQSVSLAFGINILRSNGGLGAPKEPRTFNSQVVTGESKVSAKNRPLYLGR